MTAVRRLGVWIALFALLGAAGAAEAAVDLDVRISRGSFIAGESVTLDVVVRGASGGVSEPDLGLPAGVEVLGSARSQNFSWINGRASSEIVFRYEIGVESAGHYRLGPVRVRVGSQTVEGGAVELEVTSAPRQVGGSTRGVASLTADVTPTSPYVGEPVVLRVRLVQRAALAEAPEYAPPAASGFWSERTSEPETFYAQQGGERVLVTETRTRLYPLAPGPARIGEASAALVLSDAGSPFSIFGIGQKSVLVKSAPLTVNVRALPGVPPAGFTGAVGTFEAEWSAERASTALDAPVVLRLDLRGRGNLPLMRTPPFTAADLEVFGSTIEDSLPAAGSSGAGRKRFQWTVLPQRIGRIEVRAPEFSWFDPAAGSYRALRAEPIVLRVGPAAGASKDAGAEFFPAALLRHPVDPGATPTQPWGWGLAGALLGAAVAAWRRSRPGAEVLGRQARCREWLRAIGLAKGPEFWEAAGQASHWLQENGSPVGSLPREVSASRYGGNFADEERVRRRLVELLSSAIASGSPPPAAGAIAVVLAGTAIALGIVFGPHAGDDRALQRSRAADERARRGDLPAASAEWRRLWNQGRAPGLAARLAWVDVRAGNVGEAAAWILRGELGEARDPAIQYVAERVREGGGLAGGWPRRLPLRSLEWGVLAALIAAAGALFLPRPLPAAAGLALAALVALVPVMEKRLRPPASFSVVRTATALEGADVELEAGQVVRVIERHAGRARVRIGTLEGEMDASLLAGAEPDR